MEEFIGEFRAESTAIVENLQSLLVSYDESSAKNQIAEELFRGVHTLKGTAKMFGFSNIETATHQLENLLDEQRKENRTFDKNLVEIILSTLDFCIQALNGTATQSLLDSTVGKIISYHTNSTEHGKAESLNGFCILFKPDKDVFERGINLSAIFKELKELGRMETFLAKKGKGIEKQLQNKSITFGVLDIWLSTEKTISVVEDVFMFFKSHEFEIIQLTNLEDVERAFHKFGELRGKDLSKIERSLRLDFFASAAQSIEIQGHSGDTKNKANEPVIESPSANNLTEAAKLNYINVALPKLDQMMNLVSEFVTLTGEVKYFASILSSEGLQTLAERLEKASSAFRDNAFRMRLVPIQILSVKLHRYIKEISQSMGKKIRFITEGMDTEIDKSIINQIEGPLMHIIRNAIDHGLESPEVRLSKGKDEQGTIKLSAFYSGTNVFIHIQDDGAGINMEKVRAIAIHKGIIAAGDTLSHQDCINLIFKPGFSTSDKTTEISGRGVGMDVVKNGIAELRGSIEVTTEKDLGTSFAIRLPLALSIMDVMIFKVGELSYMIPNPEIEFCTSEKFEDQIQRKGHNVQFKNKLVPFMELRSVFEDSQTPVSDPCILILNKNDQLVAVEVDEIIGKEQVVIKPIDETLQVPYLAGTSILGNGELAFLIDVIKLSELYACRK